MMPMGHILVSMGSGKSSARTMPRAPGADSVAVQAALARVADAPQDAAVDKDFR
jgi:hypothetical protein